MTVTLNKLLENKKDKHLNISDIEKMKSGDKIKLLCIDRNFYDLIDHNLNQPPSKPEDFFEFNYKIEYSHDKDLIGLSKWDYGGEPTSNSDSDNGHNDEIPFTFDLNYKDESWYPLNSMGYLPEKDPQGYCNFKGVELNYKNYPTNTRIGWRGPMLKWNDVINGDDIVYTEDEVIN